MDAAVRSQGEFRVSSHALQSHFSLGKSPFEHADVREGRSIFSWLGHGHKTGHRKRLSEPDAQKISNQLTARFGCSHENSNCTASRPAPQASRQTTLNRARLCRIPKRAPLRRPIWILRRAHHRRVRSRVISSPGRAFGRRERDYLNEHHSFDAPPCCSLSGRALPTTRTSLLLRGPLPLDTYRHRRDVAALSGCPRRCHVEMRTNRNGRR
jgi:hypothetical protein